METCYSAFLCFGQTQYRSSMSTLSGVAFPYVKVLVRVSSDRSRDQLMGDGLHSSSSCLASSCSCSGRTPAGPWSIGSVRCPDRTIDHIMSILSQYPCPTRMMMMTTWWKPERTYARCGEAVTNSRRRRRLAHIQSTALDSPCSLSGKQKKKTTDASDPHLARSLRS